MALKMTKNQKMITAGIIATVSIGLVAWLLYYMFSDKKLKEGKYVTADKNTCGQTLEKLLEQITSFKPDPDTGAIGKLIAVCDSMGFDVWYDDGDLVIGNKSVPAGVVIPKLHDGTFGIRTMYDKAMAKVDFEITASDAFTLHIVTTGMDDTNDNVDASIDYKLDD